MRFDELPRDWAQRPITDPDVLEGVVDLIVPEQARSEGATYLLLCHPNRRLLQPICLSDQPGRAAVGEVAERVRLMLAEVSRHDVHDVVVVIARPGRVTPTSRDLDLRAAFEGACRATGITVHAVAIAAPDDVAVLPAGGQWAAA
ncbi:hypothetical protein GCM10009868_12040 [Terrabacter aerolatus]|uniref:Uncharacterized protein n=1 Tax=Terrabacter aerolatus TaxID=422442 RepID=A0A512CYH6_9MICO|nr:hypothetical protein [Terrabacter aerolatus]GEO29060.1 hypothetical protein TAE01_08700 [Terrabacter aerolatus]